jgi:hypothetical protein
MPSQTKLIQAAFEAGEGILRLAPTWVPRSFCIPGRRIKLDPRDYYAFGANRGGIDERWLSSTTRADNGPLTTPDEGLSYVVHDGGQVHKVLLLDAVAELGAALLGDEMWASTASGRCTPSSSTTATRCPITCTRHEEFASLVGMAPKPEAYFYPPQMNNHGGTFPHTFFGLEPGTTKEQVRHCLEIWNQGDNKITNLSKAYRLEPGTGWYVPAGVLHAPGSLCTYEPQWASDVFAMFQSLVAEVPIDWGNLVKNVPADKHQDLDFLVSMVEWDANVLPNLKEAYFRPPVLAKPLAEMEDAGYVEKWITYGNPYFAAKELTVLPGRTATIRDAGAYGFITVQGHGTIDRHPVETPALIRFGQLTHDEYFVSAAAAARGVTIHNPSQSDPLVHAQALRAEPRGA